MGTNHLFADKQIDQISNRVSVFEGIDLIIMGTHGRKGLRHLAQWIQKEMPPPSEPLTPAALLDRDS